MVQTHLLQPNEYKQLYFSFFAFTAVPVQQFGQLGSSRALLFVVTSLTRAQRNEAAAPSIWSDLFEPWGSCLKAAQLAPVSLEDDSEEREQKDDLGFVFMQRTTTFYNQVLKPEMQIERPLETQKKNQNVAKKNI